MLLEVDIQRIFKQAEASTELGTVFGNWCGKIFKSSISKILLICGIIVFSTIFFIFGFIDRKKKK